MWIIIAIILILLFIGFIKLYRKTRDLKKIKQHLLNIPTFDNGLIDCYVKFSGRIKSDNAFSSPISKVSCAFYRIKVVALWQTKKKKPATGMEENKKVIFNTISPVTQLEIYEGKDIVHVEMAKFFDKGDVLLHEKTTESRNSHALWQQAARIKYQKYKVLESWCNHADQIVVYGKLTKTDNGLLCIKPTELAAYPSLICLAQNEKWYLKKLDEKMNSNTFWLRFILIGII